MAASLTAFLAVATLLIVAPGPDSLLVVRNTVRGGRTGGLATAAGTLTGLSLWAVAAAVGLSSLVQGVAAPAADPHDYRSDHRRRAHRVRRPPGHRARPVS